MTSIEKRIINNIENDLKLIKKRNNEKINEEKYKLLLEIANGENLDIKYLESKYLKQEKEINEVNPINEELLDKVIIDGETYYYENKVQGKVYDINNKEIGYYKNFKIILN